MLKYASAALVAVTLFAFTSSPVQAQNKRSWVASNGLDANDCSRANPCLTFNGALAKTDARGEINVVDSGDYGTAAINKSITIQSDGVGTVGVLATTNSSGFNISGCTSPVEVTLRGLDINNVANGANVGGVRFNVCSGVLHIENCTIRNYTGTGAFGINFTPNATSSLFVSDTVISGNGTSSTGGGVHVRPTARAFSRFAESDGYPTGLICDSG